MVMKTGALSVTGNITQTGTGFHLLAKGTTAQRPSYPQAGMVRYNTTLGALEVYDGTSWDTVAAGGVTNTIVGADGATSEPMFFAYDTVRSKWLSAASENFTFYNISVANDDWIFFDSALPSDVGYVMPYAGTVVGLNAYTSGSNNAIKNISVYVGSTEYTNQLSIGSTRAIATSASSTDNNINFSAGNMIRARARFGGGMSNKTLSNLILNVRVKWRT